MTKTQAKIVAAITDSLEPLMLPIAPAMDALDFPVELRMATGVVTALNSMGIQTALCAGSATWAVMDIVDQAEALNEGRPVISKFGYEFDPIVALPSLVRGIFPDTLHAWAEVMETGVIYDLTLANQITSFEELSGIAWPESTRPPDTLVGVRGDFEPNGWSYTLNQLASSHVNRLVGAVITAAEAAARHTLSQHNNLHE